MVIEKGLLATVVVVFAGFVGYKILKKKRPRMLKELKTSVSDARKKMSEIVGEARESFREGYQQT